MKEKWKFSGRHKLSGHKGYFAYIGGSHEVKLETPWISVSVGYFVPLCLTFNYSLRSQNAVFNVSYMSSFSNKENLIFNLTGYHGNTWFNGQVSWNATGDSKIIFRGLSKSGGEFTIGLAEVKILTSKCQMIPEFALPGHKCGSDEFKCDNGQCVLTFLRCDGDIACLDKSDENDCACLSDEFKCYNGDCVHVTRLCDGRRDCGDDSDEENCERPCDEFQCTDGTCISWNSTCRRSRTSCPDRSHFPAVCGSGQCSLNGLDCEDKPNFMSQCNTITGYCGFKHGMCGLTSSDDMADFQWKAGSGKTPSENTGPSFDHTTFTDKGTYIFIEASQRSPGNRARLISNWLTPNESACLQFWYHMHGRQIGALDIKLKTNNSERLVWTQGIEDHEDEWILAQTPINATTPFKLVIEGAIGMGFEGDIALDDLAVFSGNCNFISRQVSPNCDFSVNMCGWTGHYDWRIHKDKYLFLHGDSEFKRVFRSPQLYAKEVKCIRFWFKSTGKYFKRSLQLLFNSLDANYSSVIWSMNEEIPNWTFTQLPLQPNAMEVFEVAFVGLKQHGQPNISIDDISFSTEVCAKIAPSINCHNYLILNEADRSMYYSQSADMCDDTLDFHRWYRIAGTAGDQIPETEVTSRRCGARYPGWMDGRHPSLKIAFLY